MNTDFSVYGPALNLYFTHCHLSCQLALNSQLKLILLYENS